MLYDKSIKNCKRGDKMNTKDYIETKKSKKLSDIFKGVLAVGLVVGSMVTSTACKPNQPHESSSSTSTIETTTTTQQTTTETPSTTETTKIDEPIIRTDEKAEKLKAIIDAYYEKDVEPKYRRIKITRYHSNNETSYSFEICLGLGEDQKIIAPFEISKEGYEYIKDIYKNISGNGDISGIDGLQLSLNYIIKNFDDKTFDILMNAILSKQSTNQSSQDDLVR